MIVEQLKRDVTATPALMRQQVTIKASADMVRRVILPYTDFALAAVRETLVGNHLDASNRVDVKLPTRLDPTWSSRDYGSGIPYAQIKTFYSMAGYSTKTQTNVQRLADGTEVTVMGCKGVGRFAPLAVTDQFLITNWAEGRRVIGQVYFDGDGHPVFDILSDEADPITHSGVQIDFAIDVGKVAELHAATAKALAYVDPAVYNINFTGHKLDITKPAAKWHGPGWRLCGTGHGRAVMGRIAYDIDPYKFPSAHRQLLSNGLEVSVPLGSIDVNDARESIVYNDRTVAAIVAAIDAVKQQVHDSVLSSVATAPTYWEACKTYAEIVDRHFAGNFGNASFQWKGRDVKAYVEYDCTDLPTYKAQAAAFSAGTASAPAAAGLHITHVTSRSLRRSNRPKLEGLNSTRIGPRNTAILLKDIKMRVSDTILQWYNAQTDKLDYTYMLDGDDPLLQEKLDLLGNPPLIKLSDQPVPPKQPRTNNGRPRTITRMKTVDSSGNVKDADVDTSEPAVYVKQFKTDIRLQPQPFNIKFKYHPTITITYDRNILRFVRQALDAAGDTRPVVIVPGTLWDRIPKATDWVTVEAEYARLVTDMTKDPAVIESLEAHAAKVQDQYKGRLSSIPDILFEKHYPKPPQLLADLLNGYWANYHTGWVKRFKLKPQLVADLDAAPLLQYLAHGRAPDSVLKDYLTACNVTI